MAPPLAQQTVLLATLQFWPFSPAPPPPAPSSPPSLAGPSATPAPSWAPRPARALFHTWASANAAHLPAPAGRHAPSEAALRIFTAMHQHRSRTSPLTITLSLHAALPTAHLHLALPDAPLAAISRELLRPSEPLRHLFWHVFRREDHACPPPSSRDICGFAGCARACAPAVAPAHRLAFHLQRVFDRCAASAAPPRAAPRRFPPSPLTDLPPDVLLNIVLRLAAPDFAALSSASPALAAALVPVVPGLKLRLYPHQVRALQRMMAAEVPRPPARPVPLLRRLSLSAADPPNLAVDMVDGSVLQFVDMPRVSDPVGGLFCDEPGLGKTITALSLVLKTLGDLPRPPPGCEPLELRHGDRPVRAYRERVCGRFRRFGDAPPEHISSRRSRLLPDSRTDRRRSSDRMVSQPKFFQASKGVGSVPSLGAAGTESLIFLSRATLVIAPQVLTTHWMTQIELHVESDKLEVLHLRTERDLPERPIQLANDYDIVITSFELIASIFHAMRDDAPMLLLVHFLRVVVDEGHALSSSSITQFGFVSELIRVDRRWVMTGTPTPSTPRSDVDHLVALLKFIREESYGLDKQAWTVGIRAPYSAYLSESLDRLHALLSRVMIRSKKSLLTSKCHVKNVRLDFSEASTKSYNDLLALIRRNLITSDWFSSSHKESLLNKKNRTETNRLLTNLRLACCMGGTQKAEFTESDVVDTLNILYDQFRERAGIEVNDRFDDPVLDWPQLENCDPNDESIREKIAELKKRADLFNEIVEKGEPYVRLTRLFKVANNGRTFQTRVYCGKLYRIGEAFLSRDGICDRCEELASVPMVTPCGHLLCNDCVIMDKRKCVAKDCGTPYYLDSKGIPEELIEMQPSIVSADGWISNWDMTESAKMTYVLERVRNLPMNEEWVRNEPEPRYTHPKVIVYSHFEDHLKLLALNLQNANMGRAYAELFVNERDLTYRGMKRTDIVKKAIKSFMEDPDVYILLMNTRYGSEGLDFSFVEYIFLLEPLWDASVELQVISRAHRIGSKKDIFVERLVMKGSIEDEMAADLARSLSGHQTLSSRSGVAKAKSQNESSRITRLLLNLERVHSKDSKSEDVNRGASPKRKRTVEADETTVRRVRFRCG